jgi:hypothetical protein
MQKVYVDGSLSAIEELTPGKELDEVKNALRDGKVKAVNLFEAGNKGWQPIAVITRVSQRQRNKRRRKRKMVKASRRRNR